jgi:hypothetical protein
MLLLVGSAGTQDFFVTEDSQTQLDGDQQKRKSKNDGQFHFNRGDTKSPLASATLKATIAW